MTYQGFTEAYPLLILPGNATQPGVQLQVLLSCELVEEGIKLGAVAQALLHLEQLLQDAVGTGDGASVRLLMQTTWVF